MQVSTQWKYDFQWEKKMCRKEKNISRLISSTTMFQDIECEFFEVQYMKYLSNFPILHFVGKILFPCISNLILHIVFFITKNRFFIVLGIENMKISEKIRYQMHWLSHSWIIFLNEVRLDRTIQAMRSKNVNCCAVRVLYVNKCILVQIEYFFFFLFFALIFQNNSLLLTW